MKKEPNYLSELEKKDKRILFALTLAIFGILLFLAFALTVPWTK